MTAMKRGDRCKHSETGEPAQYVGTTFTGVEIVACDWQDFEHLCKVFDWRERQQANDRLAIAVGELNRRGWE